MQQSVLSRTLTYVRKTVSAPSSSTLPIASKHRGRTNHQRRLDCSSASAVTTAPSNDRASIPVSSHNVRAVLFDMDGVLCDSEDLSRSVGTKVLKELYGLDVSAEEFIPFVGTGEANFLGGVASKHGAPFDPIAAKRRFFELYLEEASKPGCKIGYKGAAELVRECRRSGLKTAVASSADRVKVSANLRAAGFDAMGDFDIIISADEFELLKPAPDVFLTASQALGVPPEACIVIEDAPAGIQASRAAGMRCIGVATTLSEAEMSQQHPDKVRNDISCISFEDIVGLERTDRLSSSARAGAASPANDTHWLDGRINLPLGYKTRRREILKLLPLIGVAGAGYSLLQNAKTLSYVSPKAILRALSSEQQPLRELASDTNDRVASYKRYIASKEARGALEQVPEFPAGLTWFNSPPLKLTRQLRGKVLLYDFWTYCCINCMHVLPSLAALERRYSGQPVAVIGVHSAKFDNEKDDASIRNAVLRYDISHPCVNDGNMVLWRELGISSWPTLAVISPRGKLIATLPGEGQEENVDAFMKAALEYYGEQGLLDDTPLPLALERDKDARLVASPLRFPGKLAVDLSGRRLFISDSNNHRIVVTDLDGSFIDQIGGNGAGLRDGSYKEAALRKPQGLAYSASANTLFVADTENHALRKVDLELRTVTTLAGNGSQGSDYRGGSQGPNQQLNSPWDLALSKEESVLYIALAGQHQIWRHDLSSGVTECFSGDGSERNANGSRERTAWAQPSGLSLSPDGQTLWVADSESSSVRSLALADITSQGHAGGDALFSENLFKFGDHDGQGSDARLQHPLAVCALPDGNVLVADSYNHRLKLLDTRNDSIKTLLGSGAAGFTDGKGTQAQLSEPGGLALAPNGAVLVADTNNSVIRQFLPSTGEVTTLQLKNVPPPRSFPGESQAADAVPPGAKLVALEPVKASNGKLRIAITLPAGYHLTEGANSRFEVAAANAGAIALHPQKGALTTAGTPEALVEFRRSAATTVWVTVKVYFCQQNDVCLFEDIVFKVPFTEAAEGLESVALGHTVSAAAPALS